MTQFVPISGPVVSDTCYVNSNLAAKDVSAQLPEVAAMTAEVAAMGNMEVPIWQLIENMELTFTKIGIDYGLTAMLHPGSNEIELRWVHVEIDAQGNQRNVGCKAFLKVFNKKIPSAELVPGEATEAETSYTVTRYQVFADGEELWLIDRLAGIVRIGGKDYARDISNML